MRAMGKKQNTAPGRGRSPTRGEIDYEGSAHDPQALLPSDETGGYPKDLPPSDAPLALYRPPVYGPV